MFIGMTDQGFGVHTEWHGKKERFGLSHEAASIFLGVLLYHGNLPKDSIPLDPIESAQRHFRISADVPQLAAENAETGLSELSKQNASREPTDTDLLDWLDKTGKWWAPERHIKGYEPISRRAIRTAMKATL